MHSMLTKQLLWVSENTPPVAVLLWRNASFATLHSPILPTYKRHVMSLGTERGRLCAIEPCSGI